MTLPIHTANCTCSNHLILNGSTQQYDPTRTISLRNAFMADLKRRFNLLAREIITSVDTNDCFGLRPSPNTNQIGPREFEFLSSQAKLDEFMLWLQEQVDRGLLKVREMQQLGQAVNTSWTNLYIEDSYKRGIIRARYEMEKAGYPVPTLAATGGIMASMSLPFHMDRVGLIYSRAYNELKGITESMSQSMSRILAQGMADGDGPALLARKLVNVITGKGETLAIKDSLGRTISSEVRAMTMARTEIIRAHHVATINEYRNWGVIGIYVKAEWKTAGDDRVCDECASMEGKTFTLDEIEGMIPLHPNCRCIALPYRIEKGGN